MYICIWSAILEGFPIVSYSIHRVYICLYSFLGKNSLSITNTVRNYLFQTKEAGKNILKTISEKRVSASSSQPVTLPDDLPEAIKSTSIVSTSHATPKTPLPSLNATPDNFSTPLFTRNNKYKMWWKNTNNLRDKSVLSVKQLFVKQ